MQNFQDIANKNVLIVGGSRGIGAKAVEMFCQLGARVVFTYNKSEKLAEEIRINTNAIPVKCDIRYPDSVKIATSGAMQILNSRIDILILNAGIVHVGLITEIGHENWLDVINTNLNGFYYCISEVLPSMISRKSGNIITVSSMWGQVGSSCEVAYSASKAGVIGLTKALAKEVGPSNIRVNCIAPGYIKTDMNKDVSEDIAKLFESDTPLERLGETTDVVNTMLYLASDVSDFITGQVIPVNGGLII